MFYIDLAEKMLLEIIKVAKEKGDIEIANAAAMTNSAIRLSKFEEQGLLCGSCGLAISEEMAEVTQGMCQCKH